MRGQGKEVALWSGRVRSCGWQPPPSPPQLAYSGASPRLTQQIPVHVPMERRDTQSSWWTEDLMATPC